MKKGLIRIVVGVAIVALSFWGGFWFGTYRQRIITNGMTEAGFVSDLTTLDRFRAGETEAAIRRVETHMFMSATVLLNNPTAKHGALDILLPKLVAYRQAYRANPNDWSPMEEKLEQLLAARK